MYGWRAKVGVICPKDNMVVEPEFYELAPDGFSIHASRLSTVELDEMPTAAEEDAAVLNDMGADVLVYACNASSFQDGPDGHAKIRDRLRSASSLPVTTASTAILKALETLDISSVDAVTPYGDEELDQLQTFLAGNGVTVESMRGLGLAADEVEDLAKVNEETARDTYRRVRDVSDEGEAVLVVSTNLASISSIGAMEADVGKPVITVNQAMFWHALRLVGSDDTVPGYGLLLQGPDGVGKGR